jgi:hypothetical protein
MLSRYQIYTTGLVYGNHVYLGPSWSWLYGSWSYNYLCNQCLSPLKLYVSSLIQIIPIPKSTNLCSYSLMLHVKQIPNIHYWFGLWCLMPLSTIFLTIYRGQTRHRSVFIHVLDIWKIKNKFHAYLPISKIVSWITENSIFLKVVLGLKIIVPILSTLVPTKETVRMRMELLLQLYWCNLYKILLYPEIT